MSETFEQKLARLLPGSKVQCDQKAPPEARYFVDGWRKGRNGWEAAVLATGSSEREAVDRALFLWGPQR